MKIALIQIDLVWERPTENHRLAERWIREAAALGARVAVLPEMFTCGFSMRAGALAEPEGGPTETWMQETAAGLGLWIIGGVPQQSPEGPRHRALLVGPDGSVQRYTKLHPFSFAEEERHYTAGDAPVSWTVEGLRITPFICYDLRFPEVFRETVDGTDLYVVIANWPERRRAHWQALLRARAIENLAFVAGVNRIGDGDGLHYSGDSALISPWGESVVGASEQAAVLVADVDPAVVREARERFPALKDRRALRSVNP